MPTYKEAYNAKTAKGEAARKKYKNFSDFEKAAKSYNTKKYGTTSPTAEAKKQGISKQKLAASVDVKKDIKNSGTFDSSGSVKPIKADKIETKDNSKIRSTVSLANNNKSLLENKRGKKEVSKDNKLTLRKAKKAVRKGEMVPDDAHSKGLRGKDYDKLLKSRAYAKSQANKTSVRKTKKNYVEAINKQQEASNNPDRLKLSLLGKIKNVNTAKKTKSTPQSLGDKLTSMTNSPRNQQAALNVAKGLKSLNGN